ncbi:MAG: zinc ribbon domain-containing protein [Phycisphaeraceae bacterium]|nr:zinc ribbon domain-containing protein [Phycisphaeraceae bacterium]
MFDRKWIIRILLGSLAAAGGLGALAMVVGEAEVFGRVALTAFWVALACAAVIGSEKLYSSKSTRAAGLLGLTGTVVVFLMVSALTWVPDRAWDVEEWWLTALIFTLSTLAAVAFMKLAASRPKARLAGQAGLCVTAVTVVLALLGVWWPSGSGWIRIHEKWWMTTLAVGGISLPALLSLVGWSRGDRWWWRWAGVLAAVGAMGLALWGIWAEIDSDPTLFVGLVATAVAIGHASGMRECGLVGGQRWVSRVAVAATVITAALFTWLVHLEYHSSVDQALLRWNGAVAVIASCATLGALILSRFNLSINVDDHVNEIRLYCPRCQKKQTVGLGDDTCENCGLHIEVTIRDQTCPQCDYDLTGLTHDQCPECGAAVHVPAGGQSTAEG